MQVAAQHRDYCEADRPKGDRWFESNCHHHTEKLEKSGFSFFLPVPGGTHFPYTKFGVGKVTPSPAFPNFDVNEVADSM